MNRHFRVAIALITCFCLAACSTVRVIADSRQAAAGLAAPGHGGLEVGDTVEVQTRDAQQMQLHITALDAQGMEGTVPRGLAPVRVAWSNVERIEERNIDGLKSTGLVVAVMAVVLVWAALATQKMFDSD